MVAHTLNTLVAVFCLGHERLYVYDLLHVSTTVHVSGAVGPTLSLFIVTMVIFFLPNVLLTAIFTGMFTMATYCPVLKWSGIDHLTSMSRACTTHAEQHCLR